jgi:acetylornithine deacetylase/succinyl-diaminopimelate desuccinylase-like protein
MAAVHEGAARESLFRARDAALEIIAGRRAGAIEDLSAFLAIPSISADPSSAPAMAKCAGWLADQLSMRGLRAEVFPTPGHPVVLARGEYRAGRPTVLVYGHYDVQPVDPIAQWTSPPFVPSIRKTSAGTDALYARGATDDKGQLWAHVEAIGAWQQAGGPPVNLILLIEGEEEIDSHHLADFVAGHREDLRADIAVISDNSSFARGIPALTTGLRGLVYSQVTLRLAEADLHSGIHGGAVINPANALARLLSGLHDETGKVTLRGFYDRVRPISQAEKQDWRSLPFDELAYSRTLGLVGGLESLAGEAGFSTLERRWARPTCDICGLTSGYQGAGAKTIIPASSTAKISFRLVADQDPLAIRAALEEVVAAKCPGGLRLSFEHFAAAPAALAPADGPFVKAARTALEIGYGAAPVLLRDGLTIPVVNLLKQQLGVSTLLVGFGLPDDRPHAPDEKIDLDALYFGSRTATALLAHIAAIGSHS